MYRATLENGGVTKRQIGHDGHPTYDVWHVHENGWTEAGVRHRSSVHVHLQEPNKTKAERWGRPRDPQNPDGPWFVRVGLWVPGGFRPNGSDEVWPDGKPYELEWGTELWTWCAAWGTIGVVSYDDAPLRVYWESVEGKA